jgi:hypothetical protein
MWNRTNENVYSDNPDPEIEVNKDRARTTSLLQINLIVQNVCSN